MSVGLRIVADTPQGRLHDERSDMSTAALARTREPFPDRRTAASRSRLPRPICGESHDRAARSLGHIERHGRDDRERYRARRVLPGGIRSIELGEFWSPREAAELFR